MSLKALMYHNINIAPKDGYLKSLYTKPSLFEKQVRLLKSLGYKSLNSNDIIKFLSGELGDSSKFVCFTFDDAYVDVFEIALPILRKYNFTAIIFVPTGLVGKYNVWDIEKVKIKKYIATWDYLETAIKDGFEIGSHTITHPFLTKLDGKDQTKEILYSKSILEDKLGTHIDSFCYPYGDYNEHIIKLVKEARYNIAFSINSGHIKPKDNPYTLKRLHMRHNTNILRLLLKLSRFYS